MRWDNCWIITLSTSHLCNIYKPVMATQNHSSLSKSDLAHTSCVQNIHFCSCPHDHACIRINIQYCCIPKHQCMSTLRKNSNFITFCSLACLDYSCLYQLCYRCSWNDATLCDMAAVRRTKVWFTGDEMLPSSIWITIKNPTSKKCETYHPHIIPAASMLQVLGETSK